MKTSTIEKLTWLAIMVVFLACAYVARSRHEQNIGFKRDVFHLQEELNRCRAQP